MNSALVRKYFWEASLLLGALAFGIALFSWFRVWVVGELDTAQFRQIIDLLPEDWRKFADVDFDWLVSYLGRTAYTLDEPMLVSLVCGWGLIRGSDVVSGELGRGTMEMLLSQPISRRRFYSQHAILTIACLFGLTLLCWGAMAVGVWTTNIEESSYPEIRIPMIDYRIPLSFLPAQKQTIAMSSAVNPVAYLPGVVNLLSLGFCFAGFAAFCSACDRYRWRTLGVVVGFYFANGGLKVLGMGSEKLAWTQYCSLLGLFHPAKAIEQAQRNPGSEFWWGAYGPTGNWVGLGCFSNCLILIGLGSFFYWLGLRIFEKRDLPAPA